MKNRILFLCCVVVAIVCAELLAEDFLVPKVKKRRVSITATKENIGNDLAKAIEKFADMIASHAQLQKRCIKRTKELLEQDSESFFYKANGQKLLEYEKGIANLLSVMEDCQKKIHQLFVSVERTIE